MQLQKDLTEKLSQRFGEELELLDREHKLQLRIALTTFIWGHGQLGDDYDLEGAWFDSIEKIVERDSKLDEVFTILNGLNIETAEWILEGLASQCWHGNAKFKTPTETMIDTLLGYNLPLELATKAAVILKEVDGVRDRTPQEQEVINQMYPVLRTTIKQRREAETISQ